MEMLESDREETEHLTEYDELPPHGVDDFLDEELKEECKDIDFDDPLSMHAAMVVKARADYLFMVPFYGECICQRNLYHIMHSISSEVLQYLVVLHCTHFTYYAFCQT